MRKLTMKEMLAISGGNSCPWVCEQTGWIPGAYYGSAPQQVCVKGRPGYLYWNNGYYSCR